MLPSIGDDPRSRQESMSQKSEAQLLKFELNQWDHRLTKQSM